MKLNALFVASGAALLVSAASAQLKITEMMSNADAVEDYFEITNFGGSAVDITGWRYDDVSASLAESVALEGVTSIGAGESVVFFELDEKDPVDPNYDPATEIANFRTAFGGLLGVQIGFHAGAGLGGSGDEINIFDASNTIVLTQGYSGGHAGQWAGGANTDAAIYIPGTVDDWTYAQDGLYGSIQTPLGDWGNPGVVPEPATMTLLALGAAAVAARKRKN